MSDATGRGLVSLVLVAALGACAVSSEETGSLAAEGALDQGTDATLHFTADWQSQLSAPLTVGHKVTVQYDAARLTTCRGDINGGPGWSITGYYRLNGGAVSTLELGGHLPSGGAAKPEIALTAPGDLELWFTDSSLWGCQAFDSAYGKNYHFTVAASANAPGWMGNAQFDTSRATCNGGPCAQDLHPLDGGFTYDTWTRSQAAIRVVQFEVWKRGVTDFSNPDLWKQLDVEIHSRVGSSGAFDTRYVSFDARTGNNARYSFDLRALDPLNPQGTLAKKSDCPSFPITFEGPKGNDYVDADVQFYFTVNGAELRPQGGGVYHGKFQNYGGLYGVCR